MSTSSAYRSLSNEQKDVLRKKMVEAKKTPDEWLAFLRPIARYDRKRDKASVWAMRLAIGGGVVAVFSFVVFISSEMTVGREPLLLGVLTLILATIRYKKLKKQDIEADLGKLVLPLLHILKEELRPSEKLQLQLDLRALEHTELIKELLPKTKKAYPRIVARLFRKRWLSGVTQLADGTALRIQITDLVRKIEKTNRNPRGKIKTKLKYKQQSRLSLALGFRTDLYALTMAQPQMQADRKIAISSREERHWVKIRRRVKFSTRSTTVPDSIPLDDFVGTMAAAFQRVTPLRKSA